MNSTNTHAQKGYWNNNVSIIAYLEPNTFHPPLLFYKIHDII